MSLQTSFTRKALFTRKTLPGAIGAVALSLAAPGFAFDTNGIQEVVVTAQKREENLQTTPIAISAMSSELLEKKGIVDFKGVAMASPSITLTPYPSSNLLILYMRGQGVSDAMQITSDSSVGIYEDGFYISRPQGTVFDLADLERVEVLRGPQGTLYGRNTTGGAVNLISKKPTGEFGLKQDFSFGTRNLFRSLTTVNLPKWNDISAKLTLLKSSKDGFVKNTGSSHDFGEEDQRAGRLALRWDGIENLTVDYYMEKGNLDSTPNYYQNTIVRVPGYTNGHKPATKTYRPVDLDLSTSDFEGHGLTVTWDVSDTLTIKSLTGYRKLNFNAYQDYMEAFAFDPNSLGTGASAYDIVHNHQFSQEFQFIGSALDNQIRYVGGLYYFKEGGSHYENYHLVLNPPSPKGDPATNEINKDRYVTADSKSQAAYAQVTWAPPAQNGKLELTLGARYTKDDRSGERNLLNVATGTQQCTDISSAYGLPYTCPFPLDAEVNNRNSQSFKRFNPAFTINYNWSDDLSGYLKIATGYKAGGSSESGPVGSFVVGFSPEKVTTVEGGLKSYWFNRRVRANMALFQSSFDDMQLAFNVNPADTSVVQAYNAGKATVKGFELELLVMPIDDLTFNVEYSWLDPEFDKVEALAGTVFDPSVNSASPYHVGQNVKEVFSLPYASKNSINVGTDYTFLHFDKGSLSAHLNYRWQSAFYDTATTGPAVPGRENYRIPAFGLLDGRVTLAMDLPRGDHAKLSVWGKNLGNKKYPAQVIGMGNGIGTYSPATGFSPAGYVSSAVIWAEPPSYGVDLSYEY